MAGGRMDEFVYERGVAPFLDSFFENDPNRLPGGPAKGTPLRCSQKDTQKHPPPGQLNLGFGTSTKA